MSPAVKEAARWAAWRAARIADDSTDGAGDVARAERLAKVFEEIAQDDYRSSRTAAFYRILALKLVDSDLDMSAHGTSLDTAVYGDWEPVPTYPYDEAASLPGEDRG